MPRATSRLTQSQLMRLDHALRRRVDGHAGIEDEWVRSVADIVATGIPVKAVADHLQVSRQTVYDWLAKAHSR